MRLADPRIIILFTGLVACSNRSPAPPADAGADATTDSGDADAGPMRVISRSSLSSCEGETDLGVSPDGRLLVAWIDDSSKIGYRVSDDLGASWADVHDVSPPAGRRGTDPVVAAAPNGDIDVAWFAFRSGYTDEVVYLSRLAASKSTVDAPIAVSDPADPTTTQYDRPAIAVTASGTIFVPYAIIQPSSAGLVMARSTDGTTFTRAMIDQTPTFQIDDPYACYSESLHRLYVAYYMDGGTAGATARIVMRWSDDEGASWPAANTTTVAGGSAALFPAQDGPACIAQGSTVWVLYGMTPEIAIGTNPKLSAIDVAQSNDGGQTFSAQVEVDDRSADLFFLHPAFAKEDDGSLDFVFYGGMADGDDAGTFRRTRLANGAPGVGASTALFGPLTFLQSHTAARWLGDYVGTRFQGGRLYSSYTDNDDTCSHVAFSTVPVP